MNNGLGERFNRLVSGAGCTLSARLARFAGAPGITVICLLSLAALVVAGTFYQVDHGLYAAQTKFFRSWFLFAGPFLLLPGVKTVLAVLVVNLFAALLSGRHRFRLQTAGVLLAHAGVIILVGGAAVSSHQVREAAITLKEGERVVPSAAAGDLTLPVGVELLSFVMSTHPGTGMAKSYESRVRVWGSNLDRETVIAMNRPFRHGAWSFYQTGYSQTDGRYSSTLSVVYNPARFIPYLASMVIAAGLLLHFTIAFVATVLARRRETHG